MGWKSTVIAGSVALAAAVLASRFIPSSASEPTVEPAPPTVTIASKTEYAALVADADKRIAAFEATVAKRDNDWLIRQHLGGVLLERATLTGRTEDFIRLDELLDEAFLIAPEGSGPLMVAARFNLSIHRLEEAERYLTKIDNRAIPRRDDVMLAGMMRGQIAMQRGEYDAAKAAFDEAATSAPQIAAVELALYHAKTSNVAEAETLLAEALAKTPDKDPRRRAWLSLQLGTIELHRGAPLVALDHLKKANFEVGGWWIVQEHLAQAHHMLGDEAKAVEILEAVVAATELPQHMDALALAYRHAGRESEAEPLIATARERWEDQLKKLPESAMGHALDHYMQFGTPERALELALANHAVRPGGEAKVALARAYLKNDRAAEALEIVKQALATPYRAAGLHDVAAAAHTALGQTAEAAEQAALRDAINPSFKGDEHSH